MARTWHLLGAVHRAFAKPRSTILDHTNLIHTEPLKEEAAAADAEGESNPETYKKELQTIEDLAVSRSKLGSGAIWLGTRSSTVETGEAAGIDARGVRAKIDEDRHLLQAGDGLAAGQDPRKAASEELWGYRAKCAFVDNLLPYMASCYASGFFMV